MLAAAALSLAAVRAAGPIRGVAIVSAAVPRIAAINVIAALLARLGVSSLVFRHEPG